ncbi:MAG: T9SS type A sorting domain-containing protein [Bacteroidales bacterium]|nr:T9SS type A sorting domain-containing protein [Bacteroidales bacterium]
MFKKIIIILIISVLIPFKMNAEWISLDKNKVSKTPPKVTLISDDNNSTIIKIELSGFNVKEINTEGKTYQAVDLMTEISSTESGFPDIPYISKILAIPDQSGVSVEVIETGNIQTFKNIYLPPARVSWFEGQPESSYTENSDAYTSTDVYPKETVTIDPPSIFRDFRIARISVFPIRYFPAKKELQTISSITVRINYGEGEIVSPKTTARKAISLSFGKLYRSFIFNYQNVLDNLYDGNESGREVMLCIMPDEFAESFQQYADWNRQSGTDIHITKFIDIDANSTNPNIIKDHITDAYYNWEHPPTYVLIIGDHAVFPQKNITLAGWTFANEDYFVEIEGDDHFPELMIGRFTNQSDYRLQVMINKFLMYEKFPYTGDTNWFKKAICCSNNAYESQVETKRFVAGLLMEDGDFTSVDTLMSDGSQWGGECTMDLDDVLDAINDGRSYLNYRGEGWSSGWNANCYGFYQSNVHELENGPKFTFVTSIGCGVAMFDSGGGNCFGEEWIELGSLEDDPGGGCAFVGPVTNTHTAYNNQIDKGIYMGMFQEGMDTPGQALLRGKFRMYEVYGSDSWVEYHYKTFCVLGDPSLHIWKDVPNKVVADFPATIQVGFNHLEIEVIFESTALPVADAQVCIVGENLFNTYTANSSGVVTIDMVTEVEEILTMTIRGGNVFPYQNTIEVVASTLQDIQLNTGYQFVSSNRSIEEPDMLDILENNLNDNLDFVRNTEGNMFRKIGPVWVNGIGDWINTEAYLFRMINPDVLLIHGDAVDPQTPIELISGYQFVSYLPNVSLNAMDVFSSILNDNLGFIRSSNANVLRKIGPNWVNGIGNANPGEGYLINMFSDDILIYNVSEKTKTSSNEKLLPVHFNFEGGNPADAVYTLYISGLEIGDEVAAFDGVKMIGAMKISSTYNFDNELPVFSTLSKGKGYIEGNPIILKVWNSVSKDVENIEFSMENISDAYKGDVYPTGDGEFSLVNFKKSKFKENLITIYPNPAEDVINISSQSQIKNVTIFNFIGQIVHQGNNIKINTNNFKHGVYIIKVETNEGLTIEKITIK